MMPRLGGLYNRSKRRVSVEPHWEEPEAVFRIGMQLLERHPGGVLPTESGKLVFDYPTLVTSEFERAVWRRERRTRVLPGATFVWYARAWRRSNARSIT